MLMTTGRQQNELDVAPNGETGKRKSASNIKRFYS